MEKYFCEADGLSRVECCADSPEKAARAYARAWWNGGGRGLLRTLADGSYRLSVDVLDASCVHLCRVDVDTSPPASGDAPGGAAREAMDILDEIRRDRYRGWLPEPSTRSSGEQIRALVDQMVTEAVAAERERWTRVAQAAQAFHIVQCPLE